ncbi:MAG: hypothetical protein DI628_06990 [Blastochloris viridis]|uniref:homoserine dehydrogenase n=1 Tax=Blastochloris viridis TaxID=1079 RepID=A0A6N4QZA6_BLAVI|nr:MAG: hypothetical protein DI628_06990 [Blastochloris viridis]
MTYSPNFPHKNRSILVVGRNAQASAVVDALARVPGVGTVRQIPGFDALTDAPKLMGVDTIVEMLGGVAPAFALAMAAMSNGIAFITANPMLMMVHGRVLRNAAQGQQAYLGFQAAGFGVPVAELMGSARPERIVVSFASAASTALNRMVFRGETLAHVSAHLRMQNADLSDWGGKQTLARALALRSLVFDTEIDTTALQRASVEQVESADVKRLRAFGLVPVFGAEIAENEIYAGPMAVAQDSALLQADGADVMVAETTYGDVTLRADSDEVRRVVAGVVADVRTLMRSPKPALPLERQIPLTKPQPLGQLEMAYVRIPFAERDKVLAMKPEILQDVMEGDGLWQAVIAVPRVRDIQIGAVGGVVYPLATAWAPQAAAEVSRGLRLVG